MFGAAVHAAVDLAVIAAVFVPLELAWSSHAAWRRPGWLTDLLFFAGQAVLFLPLVSVAVLGAAGPLMDATLLAPVRAGFGSLASVVQLVIVVMLGDFLVYWGHRAQHAWEPLWRIHAVHHTAEDVDWLAAFREHPLDGLYTQALVNLPALLLGVDLGAWLGVLVFRGLWAILLHSRARVDLGPLKWVLGSPEFHRAHHAPDPRAGHYANLAPYLDVVFGTHGPTVEPDRTGIDREHPTSWPGLLIWPLAPWLWSSTNAVQTDSDFDFDGEGETDSESASSRHVVGGCVTPVDT